MARDDAKSSSLRRRPSRTVPAAIVAVLVAAGGVAGVWATVERLATGKWPGWVGGTHLWGATQTWGSVVVIVISIVVALLGLLLLLTALRPGMPNAYEIDLGASQGTEDTEGTEFVMTRRAVAKLATAQADLVDGVDTVSATVTSRRVGLSVTTTSAQTEEIGQLVTSRVSEALAAVGLSPQPSVTATVTTTQP
ncbi:DUF6286 domain-containing protein [Lapillicoccus sp.]|uniref:DUF6286 domain-containing protein n=1 Tax=Lapillicoccus sp. TaxID=1909287 RepID=UPI0032658BD9